MNARVAFTLLATNLPSSIDPAVRREGRIDSLVKIDSPSPTAAGQIFEIYLAKVHTGEHLATMAQECVKYMFDRELGRYRRNGDMYSLTFGDISTGAMIEAIVQDAADHAIDQDIKARAKAKDQKKALPEPTGVRMSHLKRAMDSVLSSRLAMGVDTVAREWAHYQQMDLQNWVPA